MDRKFDLYDDLLGLESDNVSEQRKALEHSFETIEAFAQKVVDQWLQSDKGFVIWEQLYRFGPFILKPLQEALKKASNMQEAVLIATVLLTLGDQAAISILLDAISQGIEVCLAVRFLAKAHIIEAGDRIIECLRTLDINQGDIIWCLLAALESLEIKVPLDIIQRLHTTENELDLVFFKKRYPL